jgi:hypothetical protein
MYSPHSSPHSGDHCHSNNCRGPCPLLKAKETSQGLAVYLCFFLDAA